MNRVVWMMDTPAAARSGVARWLAEAGDRVFLAVRAEVSPEQRIPGVEYLVLNPLHAASLAAAVQKLEAEAGRLDLLVLGAQLAPHDGAVGSHDYGALLDTLEGNVCGAKAVAEAFLPLLRLGMKRIACITEREAVSAGTGCEDFGYYASCAAVNMVGRHLFNALRPEGFTFRWYCESGAPGGVSAGAYLTAALSYDEKEPYIHSDENRFVLRDNFLREISW